jgi:hypothetical protein
LSSSTARPGTEYDATVPIGNDFELRHTVTDDLDAAVNLTSATLKALVKSSKEDADSAAVATFTVTVLSAAAGTVKMLLPDTETAKLSPGVTYYYDLHVTLPAAHASYPSFDGTPIWGRLTATRIVTRSTS